MGNPRPTGVFCWAELGTSDSAGAHSFYQGLFGWTSQDRPMGEMGVYSLLSLGGEEFAGLYQMQGPMFEGVPPHWMFYIKVDDVDATYARAKELGGKEVWPAMDVPDVGRIGMIEDPTGAKISRLNEDRAVAQIQSSSAARSKVLPCNGGEGTIGLQ